MNFEILGLDQFDRIPDCLVLIILKRVKDDRALERISAVSKRFYTLFPLGHDSYVKINWVVPVYGDSYENILPKLHGNLFSRLLKPTFSTLCKPLNFLHRNADRSGKFLLPLVCDCAPSQVLKNFTTFAISWPNSLSTR